MKQSELKKIANDLLRTFDVEINKSIPTISVKTKNNIKANKAVDFFVQGEGASSLFEGIPSFLSEKQYIVLYLESAGTLR